jgi:hypothetical protein
MNKEEAELKVKEKLSMNASLNPFFNDGIMTVGDAELRRQATNNGNWRAQNMTVRAHPFTNKGFGNLTVGNHLIVDGQLLNDGDLRVKNSLQAHSVLNTGSIKGDDLTLGIQGEVTNRGQITAKNITGQTFTNTDKGAIKVAESLKISDHLSSDGDLTVQKHLQAKSAENKGTIRGSDLSLDVQGSMTNHGSLSVKTLTGEGNFQNHRELRFIGESSEVNVGQLLNKTKSKDHKAVISGKNLSFLRNRSFVNGADSVVNAGVLTFLDAEAQPRAQIPTLTDALPKFKNEGTINAESIITRRSSENSGSLVLKSVLETHNTFTNRGKIQTRFLHIDEGKFHNLEQGVVEVLERLSLKPGSFINEGELKAQNIHIDAQGTLTNIGLLTTYHLQGAGTFLNQGDLRFAGTAQSPSQLGILKFENGIDSSAPIQPTKGPATVRGSHVQVTKSNQQFINHANSEVAIDRLTVAHNPTTLKTSPSTTTNTFMNKGSIKASSLEVSRPGMTNQGSIRVLTFGIHGWQFENAPQAILQVDREFDADVEQFENKGDLLVQGKFKQGRGVFINTGKWEQTGDVNIGSTKVTNQGTMSWQKGSLSFTSTGFENHGNWELDRMVISQRLKMQNYKTLHLKDGSLDFSDLVNHKDLVVSGGSYRFYGNFINHSILRLLNHDWIFTQGSQSTGQVQFGEIERQKSYTHDAPELPKAIRAQGDVIFTKQYASKRSLDDLSRVTTPGRVIYYISPFLISSGIEPYKNYEFKDIGHLDLYVTGNLKILHELKAPLLTVNVEGSLTCGSSNEAMGAIAATAGPLTVVAHQFDTRFGRLYGKGQTHIKSTKSHITVGSPKQGIDPITKESYLSQVCAQFGGCQWLISAFRPQYSAILDSCNGICNGAYISSDDEIILESADEIQVDCGTIFSILGSNLIAKNDIINTAGYISSLGKTRLQGRNYKHLRKPKGNPGGYEYPTSGPAVLESTDDIAFYVQNVLNQAGVIRTGGKYIVNGTPSQRVQNKDTLPNYTEEAIAYTHTYFNGHGWGTDWGWKTQYLATLSCILQSAEAIQINTGNFKIMGSMHAPVVAIQALGSGLFHNISRTREVIDLSLPVIMDYTHYVQQEVQNNGLARITQRGEVLPEFAYSAPFVPILNQDAVMFANPEHPHHIQPTFNHARVFNPLMNLPIGLYNLFAQSAFAKAAGKVPSKKDHGDSVVETFFNRGTAFGRGLNKTLVTMDDIKSVPYTMMLPALKEEGGEVRAITYLIVPPSDINPYQSSGDLVGEDKFTCTTQYDQTHFNNRIVSGEGGTALESTEGKARLETQAYTISHETKECKETQDFAMPQQTLLSQGPVHVSGHKGMTRVGTGIEAQGDVKETAQEGKVEKLPLILCNTVESHREENSFFGGSKVTSESSTSHAFMPTSTRAGKNIEDTGGHGIKMRGAKDEATEDLVYNGEALDAEAAVAMNLSSRSTNTEGAFSSQHQSSSSSTAVAETNLMKGKRIIINTKTAKLKATDFVALVLQDNTKDGMEVGSTIVRNEYSQSAQSESPLAKSDVGCEGWYEVMLPSRMMIKEIVRNIDEGEIKLESVDWNKDRTQIIGKVAETVYQLKRHHREWAEITQVIPNEALVVVALAITIATQGAGGKMFAAAVSNMTGGTMVATGTGMSMASAAFTTVCTQAATSFLSHGDLARTGKELFSSQGIRALGTAIATAGLIGDGGSMADLSFGQRLAVNGFRNLVKAGVSSAIENRNIGDTLKEGGIGTLVDSISGSLAKNIGEAAASQTNPLTQFEHKAAHFGIGAAMGAVLDHEHPLTGAVTGGMGAMMAEVVAETLVDRPQIEREVLQEMKQSGEPFSMPAYKAAYREKLQPYINTARLVVGSTIAAMGHNPTVAIAAATNALENNFAGTIPMHPEVAKAMWDTSVAATEAIVETAEDIYDNPDEFIEAAVLGTIPYGEITQRFYLGETVSNLDLAIETGFVLTGTTEFKAAAKTGAKVLGKVASKFTQKLEKAGRVGKSTNVDALDLASTSKKNLKNLLPQEGRVGTYGELKKISRPGDNLTPHHIPQSEYMKKNGVAHQDGISMLMEHPYPGAGGRHRSTLTYGKQADMTLNPREQLARDIFDARNIYQKDNLYTSEIRKSLMEVVEKNKKSFPSLYNKNIDGVL